MNFLLVLTELFSLGVTAEALPANNDWKSAYGGGSVSALGKIFTCTPRTTFARRPVYTSPKCHCATK